MQKHPLSRLAAAMVCGIALTACGGGGGGGSSSGNTDGTFSLALTDAAVDNAAEVYVQVTGVSLKPQSGNTIEFMFDPAMDIDLLTLVGENSITLLNNEVVPAGGYNWIALSVNAEFDSVFDSYIVDDVGGMIELAIPSGSQSGLRLVSGFTVTANQNSSFVIDWDLRKGLTDPVGQPGWLLKPALRITDMTEHGGITGTVADDLLMDADCSNDLAEDVGNAVYVYEGDVADPDDIGGLVGTAPLTTAPVTQDQSNGVYTYSVAFLSPGDYTAALNCQGLSEDPDADDELVFLQPTGTTVVDGEDSVVNFE